MGSSPPRETVDDPVTYFLDEQRFHGKSQRTLDAYERVIRDFLRSTSVQASRDDVEAVSRRKCMEWIHGLRDVHEPSTVASYASYVHRFYTYMMQIGVFERNPMALVIEEMPEEINTNPVRREISVDEMREFISRINHPLERAIIVTLLKTGMRVGELCNLDSRDVNLVESKWDSATSQSRAELSGRPGSLYVDAVHARGRESNGDVRAASNKRQRSTVVPVDEELETVLGPWLLIRPDPIAPGDPLFVDTSGDWGERLEPAQVRYIVRKHTELQGWYQNGDGSARNVTPHYFRHFFTTYLREEVGDRGIVKYLRGDVADDIIDTYTHNWGERVRRHYLDHIYSLI